MKKLFIMPKMSLISNLNERRGDTPVIFMSTYG